MKRLNHDTPQQGQPQGLPLQNPAHPKIGRIGVQTILAATLGLAIAFTLGCEEKSAKKKITGVYEYSGGYYMVLSEKDGKITGLYYGEAQDFDDTPEGYEPRYFVVPMNELKINGDSIKFVLSVSDEDCFAEPIDGKITSTQEAVKAGYQRPGSYTIGTNQREYTGYIQADGIMLFKEDREFMYSDRKFIYSGGTAEEIAAFFDALRQARLVLKKELIALNEATAAAALARAKREEALAKETAKLAKTEREKALKEGWTFTDERDGKIYRFVKIGEQIWMAENLNYYVKGELFDDGSYCYGSFSTDFNDDCLAYGRLYNKEAAKKACPSGWHLPSDDEWKALVNFAGGEKIAGKKLKAKSGWDDNEGKSGNGTDAFGFSALPGGNLIHTGYDIEFQSVGYRGHWWSATEVDRDYEACWLIDYAAASVVKSCDGISYSVRCVKDENKTPESESEPTTTNNEVSQ